MYIGLPSVTVTPTMQTAEVTLTVVFTATVTGVGPFNYQWQKGNQILTNETRNTYIIRNASQEDEEYYRCQVTNNFGNSAVSNIASLQVASMYPVTVLCNVLQYWSNASLPSH